METFFERLFMSDEPPSVFKWICLSCDYIGLGFVLVGTEEWWRVGDAKSLDAVGIGVAFLFFGVMGPKMKGRMNTKTSPISPSKIVKEIRAARPMQREALQQTFVGVHVAWVLRLYAVQRNFSDQMRVQCFEGTTVVSFPISKVDENLLSLARQNELIHVSGIIDGIFLEIITLKDVTFSIESK